MTGGLHVVTERKFTNTDQDPDTQHVRSHSADMISIGRSSVSYLSKYQYYKLVCRTTGWHNIQEQIHLNHKILQNSIRFLPILETNFGMYWEK